MSNPPIHDSHVTIFISLFGLHIALLQHHQIIILELLLLLDFLFIILEYTVLPDLRVYFFDPNERPDLHLLYYFFSDDHPQHFFIIHHQFQLVAMFFENIFCINLIDNLIIQC